MRYFRAITIALLFLGLTLIAASIDFGATSDLLRTLRSLLDPVVAPFM